MGAERKDSKGVKQIRAVLERNRGVAQELPHPEEQWTSAEMGLNNRQIHTFSRKGIIEKAGDVSGNTNANLWKTTPRAYEYAKSIERKAAAPCGYSGVKNLGDGEFTCTEKTCDCRFDRETAEQVLNGNGV